MNRANRAMLFALSLTLGMIAWMALQNVLPVPVTVEEQSLDVSALPLYVPITAGLSMLSLVLAFFGELNRVGAWFALSLCFGAFAYATWHVAIGFPWWLFAYGFMAAVFFMTGFMSWLGEALGS